MYSKHQSGAIAELKVAQYFLEHEYEIFFPTTSSIVDFIALKNDETLRVQVKNAYSIERPTGANYVQATTRRNSSKYGHQTYEENDYDILAVVYENKLWLFPCKDVYHLKSIVLEKGQQKRRPSKNNFDAEPYRIR